MAATARTRVGLASLALLACLAAARVGDRPALAAAGAPEVTAIRVDAGADRRTRVTVDLDRPVSFRTLVTPRPPRLVVDLPEIEWRLSGGAAVGRPGGLVTAHRHGLFAPGRSRLVLDLAAPFRVAHQLMVAPAPGANGYRLVLDLEPLPPAVPATVAAAMPSTVPAPVAAPPPPPAVAIATAPATVGPPPSAVGTPPRNPPPYPLPRPATITVVAPAAPSAIPDEYRDPVVPPATSDPAPVLAALIPPAMPEIPPAPPPEAVPPRLPAVVIDPGHGGVDPGAVGVGGVLEKAVVLEVALELRDELRRSGRYRAVLTREADVFLPLRERVALAREAGGEVFISLHADSLGGGHGHPGVGAAAKGGPRGASVYTLSTTGSDAEAERLAGKENKADILAATDLSHHDAVVTSILIDLAQRDTNNRSIGLADIVAEELAGAAPAVSRRRRSAGFAVLKSPDVPSVLVELGYLSNPEDAHNLSQGPYRQNLAAAVLKALDRYFGLPRS